ncbi:DUF917 family protein [Streptomyces sp. NPDC059479]|uniref:S-methyl thiohydantoin desulfurase domain-containing protein n=1 Tax=Streptomyces sp. NPDC059479 TaxID=3346848 RepID=UPI003680737D
MTAPHTTFGIDAVDDLALGSALVGCGGGGTSHYSAVQLRQVLRHFEAGIPGIQPDARISPK